MSRPRRAAFALHAIVTFAVLALAYSWVSRGRTAVVTDLPQDYASARAWLDGDSPYLPLAELHVRYGFPPPEEHVKVRTNPHPPVAVLLTVPYARLDFPTALEAVRWTQLVALSLVWAWCFELFRPPVPGFAWSLAGGLFGLWVPVWQGLAWAQPIGLLALGTLGLWVLGRSKKCFAFGLLLALVTLVRPFVAIHIVQAVAWNWRQRGLMAAGLLVGAVVPFALLGVTPWEWYRLASDAGHYVNGCGSLPGVFELGPKGGQILYAVAAAVLAWVRWRGLDADTTAALAAVTAMLAYPLAWFQYDTSLVPVVAWVTARVAVTGNRLATWSLVVYVLLRSVPDMIATPGGTGFAEWLARNKDWLQVLARMVLLGAVVAVRGRPPAAVSAGGPS